MQIMTDSPIRFPGLFGDWAFTASSKALDIGNGIYWYGILIALGLVIAIWWCMNQKSKYGITEDDLLDSVLWGIPCAIVGARIYYVLFYLDQFKNSDGSFSFRKAIAIWDGGLAIYGAVIAVVIVGICVSRHRGYKLGAMLDLAVMGLLIGQCIGRWGNFMNREAFGAETTLPWRMQLTTVTGQLVEVHPTFLYESLWNLVGLLLIIFVVSKARRFDGENTWFYFLWYGIGRFWVEGLRTDSLYLFNWTIGGQPIRVSQALSLVMVFVSLFMLYYNIKLHPHKPEELYVNIVAARNAAAAEVAAARMRERLRQKAAALPRQPGLAVILVGDDPASAVYVRNKEKDCAQCGVRCLNHHLPAEATQQELLALVEDMNRREDVDGILVQLPLPEGLDSRAVLEAIRPEKDVDAFHPENVGRLMLGLPRFLPCTPAGIMALLRAYGISPAGKHCVVVGRSNIVGKPMALLLLAEDATVTVCHSRTPDLAEQCRRADILISAVGRRGLITSDMVKPGAVVVDVAMNRNEEGKLCGDVDFAAVAEKAAYITPVPGGVGPMTRAMLMENTVSASCRRQRKED